MKYFEAVNAMLNNKETGFKHIHNSDTEFKNAIISQITRAKCSIATARVFIGFVEVKLEQNQKLDLSDTMLESAVLVGNGVGLDPTRYSEVMTEMDSSDLRKVLEFMQ
jgi:hypothetical protein